MSPPDDRRSPRAQIEPILRAALAAADPRDAVLRAVRVEGSTLLIGGEKALDLSGVRRLRLVGAGKATPRLAEGVLELLGAWPYAGTITTSDGCGRFLPGLEVWEARHPLPDARGLAGASEALHLARGAGPGDLVLCLLSGGASALWPAPPDGVTLGDVQDVTRALLRAGAPIAELNAVRKHLSRIAGGQLARRAAPARVLTLAISDVVGAPPDTIGSGPTLPDPTTFADALRVLRSREVDPPPSVLRHLQAGTAGEAPETVKPGELTNLVGFHVLASLPDALAAASREAERLGYTPELLSDRLEGEARVVGAEVARTALRARGAGPRALLWGGETTVTVRGNGRGGRNQELALAAALVLEGEPGVAIAALGTDGIDGPTDAAGGVVDGGTLHRGRTAGADPKDALRRNDSHAFLRASGDLLVTGPTGTNVNDLVVALVG